MKGRRGFVKFAAVAAPATFGTAMAGVAHAEDGGGRYIGTWITHHELPPGYPFPYFFEMLSITPGGVVYESNGFLHTASNLALPGVPFPLNASDGAGNWSAAPGGAISVRFRKLLFNGTTGQHVGFFRVDGRVFFAEGKLSGEWNVIRMELFATPPIDLTGGSVVHTTDGVLI